MSQAFVHISSKNNSTSFVPLYPIEFSSDFMYVQRVGVTYCLDDYVVKNRNIDSNLLCYVFQGEGTLEYKGEVKLLKKGDLFLINCSELHSYYPNTANPFYLFFVHFNGPLTKKYVDYITQDRFIFQQVSITKDLINRIGKIYTLCRSNSEVNKFKISEIIYSILITLINTVSILNKEVVHIPAAIVATSKYIEENFVTPISIPDLAKKASMSEYHFIREFKKYIHQSPYNYVLYCRFEHSKELLLTTTMPIAEIADFLCFHSVSHYTLFFKKRESMTPFQFRKRYTINT